MAEIQVKGFHVKLHGDHSVGIWDAYYTVEGEFFFESKEDLEEFRESLRKTFELVSDMGISVDAFEEIKAADDFEKETDERIHEYEKVEASDDLKANFRSWEADHDNQEDADSLFFEMSARHPHCKSAWLRELCDNWVGYDRDAQDTGTDTVS